ncbi:unnamed protein product [Dibothriocephalus latus]|uniref:Uncharacterized protein n=1 Tax=Dibothriocephalus latus TaxID=60516 RepID=A0A3P7PBZ6_DIBLA|nr:unnamed protein product [Dibothriocephalus latus]
MDAFDELQTASLDSMHEVDGRRFWSQRFSLDSRLDVSLTLQFAGYTFYTK